MITPNRRKQNKHQCEAYKARQAMKDDPVVLTFHFQKAHVISVLTTNKACYKHQLKLYNEVSHNSATNQGYAHLWTENIAKRGSREISSVVYRFVKKIL